MEAIIRLDVPDWQIGQPVTVYFKDTMMKHSICELETDKGDSLLEEVLELIKQYRKVGEDDMKRRDFVVNKQGETKSEFIEKYKSVSNIAEIAWFFGFRPEELIAEIKAVLDKDEPQIKEVEVDNTVKCKDCKYAFYRKDLVPEGHIFCTAPHTERGNAVKSDDWFCANGEKYDG